MRKSLEIPIRAQDETAALRPQRRNGVGKKRESAKQFQRLIAAPHATGKATGKDDADTLAAGHSLPRPYSRDAYIRPLRANRNKGPSKLVPDPNQRPKLPTRVCARDGKNAAKLN